MAGDALRYWELRRIVYNCVLTAVIIGLVVLTWPHFGNALTFSSFLKMTVLGLLANACYFRPVLWLAGTLFATLLATSGWLTKFIPS